MSIPLPSRIAVLMWVALACGCPANTPSGQDAACPACEDAGPDAGGDSGLDAGTCIPDLGSGDASLATIQLPPSGEHTMTNISSDGQYVVYAEDRDQQFNFDVYLYDLTSATELQLTSNDAATQRDPSVWNGQVMWSDRVSGVDGATLWQYDIASQQRVAVLSTPTYTYAWPRFNMDYVLYVSTENVPNGESGFSLYILNRATGDASLVASYDTYPETASVGSRLATWVAQTNNNSGTKDVFWHDPTTGVTERIDSTDGGNQFYPTSFDTTIVWEDDRNGNWDIYTYDTTTGVERRLTRNDQDQGHPRMRNHLVTWLDYRYSCGAYWGGVDPGDIVIYDMLTGQARRVTPTSDYWNNLFAHEEWVVYLKQVGDSRYHVFARDLVQDGILDGPNGSINTGDVVEP